MFAYVFKVKRIVKDLLVKANARIVFKRKSFSTTIAMSDSHVFQRIPAGRTVTNVLKARLPHSALLYNMVQFEDIPNCDMKVQWFTLNGSVASDCWILATFWREEDWYEYIPSPPSVDDIPEEALQKFQTALVRSSVVEWAKPFIFTGVCSVLVQAVKDAIHESTGTVAKSDPCHQFYMDASEAAALDISYQMQDAVLRSLDAGKGADFIGQTWKYGAKGSIQYTQKQILELPSAGIYVDEEPVSGVVLKRHGAIGMLFTKPEHRNKGYGVLVMKYLMKQLGELGIHPCSHVNVGHDASTALHEKLGFKSTHIADFVIN